MLADPIRLQHAGRFDYTPYRDSLYSPGYGMDFYALALLFLTISTTVGVINFIVTIFRLRAPGMAISRMRCSAYHYADYVLSAVFSRPAVVHGVASPGVRICAHSEWCEPPKFILVLIMLAVLLSSSVVLRWGEKRVEEGQF